MANTKALQYQAEYVQSNTDRYEKFREEAYKEFIQMREDQAAYLKVLNDQAKALEDAIASEKKAAAAAGKGMDYLDYMHTRQSLSDAKVSALQNSASRRMTIEQQLKGELTVSPSVSSKINDAGTWLTTNGALLTTPADSQAAIDAQINEVSKSLSPGDRSSVAAAQDLYNTISTSSAWGKLDQSQRDAVEQHLAAAAGLDALNVAGISGKMLLNSPLSGLLQKETEQKLKSMGGAYGVSDYDKMIADLDAKWAAEHPAGGTTGTTAAKTPNEIALKALQDKIAGYEIPGMPAEAAVRARAREKFEPEASPFLRDQFARDVYLADADKSKVVHYDAIKAAQKIKKLDEESAAYKAAKLYVDNASTTLSKADQRKAVLDKATEWAGGDAAKRDAFLVNYHAIEMGKHAVKFGPSDNAEASYIPGSLPHRPTAEDEASANNRISEPFKKLKALAAAPTVVPVYPPSPGPPGHTVEDMGEETQAEAEARARQYAEQEKAKRQQDRARALVAAGKALISPSTTLTMEDLFKQQF